MKKCSYKRLQLTEREEISRGLAVGRSLRSIAVSLGRSPSTVSRELYQRDMERWNYRAIRGHWQAKHRRRKQGRKRLLVIHKPLCAFIAKHILLGWSPMQIVKRLKKKYPTDTTMHVSHETIYAHLYALPKGQLKKKLLASLRRKQKFRRPKNHAERQKQGRLPAMVSIEERPEEVADRIVPGHWEGDLIVGLNKRSAIGTLVERTTRLTIIVPVSDTTATAVRTAFTRAFKHLPIQLKKTLTYDQGKEMSQHELFTKQTKIKVYFAHGHSPWERGTNENTNGLIRQYFPKGTDFKHVARYQLKRVQELLNNRPRKTLDWDTPHETFTKLLR